MTILGMFSGATINGANTQEVSSMTKTDLVAGMVVVTADGVNRAIIPTTDGLIAISSDNKGLLLSKATDDMRFPTYSSERLKDIVKVYGTLKDITSGGAFSTENRELLFDRTVAKADDLSDDLDLLYSNDMTLAGNLVVLRNGSIRLGMLTCGGVVFAKADGKFISLEKYDDSFKHNKSEERDIVEIWSLPTKNTTDFFSTDSRTLVWSCND